MDDRELDLDALEKVALAATQEPWEWDSGIIPPDGPGRYADIYTDAGELIIAHFNDQIPEGQANAAHIASFDPPTVLKLIALARPKAGGVEADGLVKRLVECVPFLRNGDVGSRGGSIELNRIASLIEALAAAPEPLRVGREDVAKAISPEYAPPWPRADREFLSVVWAETLNSAERVLALIGTSGGKDLGSDRCVGPSSDAQSVRPDGGEG